jgi:hypothetical protein
VVDELDPTPPARVVDELGIEVELLLGIDELLVVGAELVVGTLAGT